MEGWHQRTEGSPPSIQNATFIIIKIKLNKIGHEYLYQNVHTITIFFVVQYQQIYSIL